jgi:DNA polymerase III alpha subunit (gram-positive type)
MRNSQGNLNASCGSVQTQSSGEQCQDYSAQVAAETYFVTDIEADGPIPGPYSMLSLASVACDANGQTLGEFSVNLDPLPGASTHPTVMEFWAKNPEAWAACHVGTQNAIDGTRAFGQWIRTFPGRPVLVAYPAGFDFMWTQWYLVNFTARSPFRDSAIDIKTLAMLKLGTAYSQVQKHALPPEWTEGLPHTHIALDDAREQAALFRELMKYLRHRLACGSGAQMRAPGGD